MHQSSVCIYGHPVVYRDSRCCLTWVYKRVVASKTISMGDICEFEHFYGIKKYIISPSYQKYLHLKYCNTTHMQFCTRFPSHLLSQVTGRQSLHFRSWHPVTVEISILAPGTHQKHDPRAPAML